MNSTMALLRKIKKNLFLDIFFLLMTSFFWILMFSSPLIDEVLYRGGAYSIEVLIFLIFLLLFYLKRNLLGFICISTFLAFVVSVISVGEFNSGCNHFCFGFINKILGLACGYARYGCELENFILSFLLIFLMFYFYRMGRSKKNGG
jgi:hypothetical protein